MYATKHLLFQIVLKLNFIFALNLWIEMVIEYNNHKDVKCYRDFVLSPYDRKAQTAFSKIFSNALMEPAKKLHDRLISYSSAGAYNAKFGSTDNRIEIKQGCANKEPIIMKVRVGRSSRKFFNHKIDLNNLLLTKDWNGDFNSVETIYVIAINNHDYNI